MPGDFATSSPQKRIEPRFAIGVDLGGTMIKAAIVERDRGLVTEMSVETEAEHGPEHVLDRVADVIRQIQDQSPEYPIDGVGIGAQIGRASWRGREAVF